MRVRVGLHVGETINELSDMFGKAVILAARIATLAQGGQILVSSTLHDLASNAGDLQFAPLGEKRAQRPRRDASNIRGRLAGVAPPVLPAS